MTESAIAAEAEEEEEDTPLAATDDMMNEDITMIVDAQTLTAEGSTAPTTTIDRGEMIAASPVANPNSINNQIRNSPKETKQPLTKHLSVPTLLV